MAPIDFKEAFEWDNRVSTDCSYEWNKDFLDRSDSLRHTVDYRFKYEMDWLKGGF